MISCQTALVIISCNHDNHERDFSGQPYHYWRSFKAVAENCWSNGTHSLGTAWFTA